MLVNHRQGILRSALTLSMLSIASASFSATPNWQGPYVGAYVGGATSNNNISTSTGLASGTSFFATTADAHAVKSASSTNNSPNSLIAGIQAGHDWVWNQMVYGIAAEYGAMPLKSSDKATKLYPDNPNTFAVYTSMRTNWLFTLRGRLGYQAMLHWPSLLYVTGGLAATQLKVTNSFGDNSALAGTGGTSTSQNQIGWTAGVGVELATFGHATIDCEYLYMEIPSVTTSGGAIFNSVGGFGVPVQSLRSPFATTGDFSASLIRVGLNYRFEE